MLLHRPDEPGGSSPRLRGTRDLAAHYQPLQRFIPAFAGNAPHHAIPNRGATVHPRVCGERTGRCNRRRAVRGSSPRLRGTQVAVAGDGVCDRFIPAFAGNAPPTRAPRPLIPVHPRVCGERTLTALAGFSPTGSSPRLRGTQLRYQPGYAVDRFIPAFAGNAESPGCEQRPCPVHPRVCGERAFCPCCGWEGYGSSPRLRGTPRAVRAVLARPRFIPAFAGNACPPAILRPC